MDLGPVGLQAHPKRLQAQAYIQTAAEVPAADGAGEDIHHHRQVDKATAQADIS